MLVPAAHTSAVRRSCACGLTNHNRAEHAGQVHHVKWVFGLLEQPGAIATDVLFCQCKASARRRAPAVAASTRPRATALPFQHTLFVDVTLSKWGKFTLPSDVCLHGLVCVRCGALAVTDRNATADYAGQRARLLRHLAARGVLSTRTCPQLAAEAKGLADGAE